ADPAILQPPVHGLRRRPDCLSALCRHGLTAEGPRGRLRARICPGAVRVPNVGRAAHGPKARSQGASAASQQEMETLAPPLVKAEPGPPHAAIRSGASVTF